MDDRKKKVLVALSGGVDSSVSAALLKEQGYEVEGAFIKTWQASWLPCTWREERRDAMRVAAHLHIPFHTIDLSKEYEHDVVNYLVREYREGQTPNPDVMCNTYIKFGGFFDWACAHGFGHVATGHYARVDVQRATDDQRHTTNGEQCSLLAGVDKNKDQSYFLWTLTQRHLSHTLFPVGAYEKSKVRELACAFGLPTAAKKDSQGVCFLGKLNMKEFLSHYIESTPGDVLEAGGSVVGRHDGAVFFTLGQRHGFSVYHTSPDTPPLYVVAKDMEYNTITVAPRGAAIDTADTAINLRDVNWISGHMPDTHSLEHGTYRARLRYRQPLFQVRVDEATDTTAVVTPLAPQEYVPKGQSLVIYRGDECMGGGIIM